MVRFLSLLWPHSDAIRRRRDKWVLSLTDSIGIEIVGRAAGPKNKEVYEAVTDKQNESLKWLVSEIASKFNVPMTEVYRHPDIGRKNKTEASTAKWE